MTLQIARRLAAHDFAGRVRLNVFRAIGVLVFIVFATVARADAIDDTLAKFLTDKFPQTAAAIGELSAEAPPQAAAILEALGDNRLMIDPADHIVAYKTAAGALLNAKTGEDHSRLQRLRLQEGPRQQRASKRDRGRDGITDPRQSRPGKAPRRG